MSLLLSWLRPAIGPLAVAGALSALYLFLAPQTGDHAAQVFRIELFQINKFAIWNNWWLGGHHLPTYSPLSPAIGSLVGFRMMGVLAVLGSVFLFALIVDRHWGETATAGAIWFGATACISLYTGRLTFALGVVVALLAVFLIQRGNRRGAIFAAAMVALASPVAALFLACAGVAHWLAVGRSQVSMDWGGLEMAASAFLPAILIVLLFPGGGAFPYDASSFLPVFLVTIVAALVIPAKERLIRVGLLVYAAALVAAFLFDTPMGGNANRMGVLLTGPLVACAAWSARRLVLLLLAPVLLFSELGPVLRELERVAGEESVEVRYYEPLVKLLEPKLAANLGRVEVVPLENHWESAWVAQDLPLARGWERQADLRLNELFYEGALDPGRYRAWLDDLAVRYVAVPRADLDYSAKKEVELIASRLDFLEEIAQTPDWSVYRVRDPRPMVDPPAKLVEFEVDSFSVSSPREGSFRLAIRWTPYWAVKDGLGCVSEDPNGFTEVFIDRPGRIEVEASFRPLARFDRSPRCSS